MKSLFKLLLCMVVVIPCQAQKVKPALNLVKNNTYYLASDINSAISQTVSGQQNDFNIDMTAKTAFKVIDVKDTVYSLEVSYKSIGMKMQAQGNTVEFSSDKKDTANVASQLLAALVDKVFLVTLSKSGKVLDIKNIDKIFAAVFDGMTKVDTAQKSALKGQFMQSFGEKAFKGNLEESLAIYPGVKVAKTDTWLINTRLESAMQANVQSTYKLVDITAGEYIIHGDSKVATIDGKASQINGMPITYNLKGTITSDIKADKATGWVNEAKIVQDISGNFEIKDNPKVPGGMVVPMTIHSNILTTDK